MKKAVIVIFFLIGAIGISLAHFNEVLTTVSLLIAIGFSIYKFTKIKK